MTLRVVVEVHVHVNPLHPHLRVVRTPGESASFGDEIRMYTVVAGRFGAIPRRAEGTHSRAVRVRA